MMNDNNPEDYTEPTEDEENSETKFSNYEQNNNPQNGKTWFNETTKVVNNNPKYISKMKSSKYSRSPKKKNQSSAHNESKY